MSDTVTLEISDHVATVKLNRAAKRNAVNMEMFAALVAVGDELKNDPGVRAVVLTGSGEHFCSGIDVATFKGSGIGNVGSEQMNARDESPANLFQSAAYVWREIPVPVIAALRGCVFGAGLQIALGADIRYAAADVQMSIMEIKWGLIPDMAISLTLRHVVPTDKVRELCFTGRIVSGQEAADIGLVTALNADPLQAALDVARDIAARSPDAIRADKKLINEAWDADPSNALRQEAELQIAMMAGGNQKEAVLANLAKRMPEFNDPKG